MEEILHQLRFVVYPIIYKGFIHPNGGCLGFLNHQPYGPVWNILAHRIHVCYILPTFTLKKYRYQANALVIKVVITPTNPI